MLQRSNSVQVYATECVIAEAAARVAGSATWLPSVELT